MPRRRSLYITAPRTLGWIDSTLPALQPHEILVQTTSGAISQGTELARYRGSERAAEPPRYPLMSGYESVGIVTQRGADVRNFEIGDRVVAAYGHRSHAILDARTAIKVPRDVSDQAAILSILSCDVEKGIRKLNPQNADAVLITGAGVMGLLSVIMLRARGLAHVDVIEPDQRRREVASQLGARAVYTPDQAAKLDAQYPLGLECSDLDAGFALLQIRMAREGRICVLADGNIEALRLQPEFHTKELTIVGSSDGWDYAAHAAWWFDYVRRTNPPLDLLFDVQITPDALIETFEGLDEGTISAIKVLVEYPS